MSGAFDVKKPVSRRRFLKRSAVGAGVTAAALASPGLIGVAGAHGGTLHLRVIADLSLLEIVNTPNGGPFYVPGTIWTRDLGTELGSFHCWGFFYDGGALGVVSQEFNLTGRGKIQVQGVEDEGPRAVTGGTGAFRNVRGEMTGADLSAFPDFTVNFRLIGARS